LIDFVIFPLSTFVKAEPVD